MKERREPMLERVLSQRNPAELVAIVIDTVADRYGLKAADILGRRRNATFAWARQVAVYLSQDVTGETNAVIGTLFGLDWTTVSYATRKVRRAESDTPQVAATLADIRSALVKIDPIFANRRAGAEKRPIPDNGKSGGALSPPELELHLLLKDLRRDLTAALRTNPAAVLAGLRRTCDAINGDAP